MSYNHPYLEKPTEFAVGREEARSVFTPSSKEGTVIDLSGKWKFEYFEVPEATPDGFYRYERDISKLNDIDVPGEMELQGYGIPQYVNVQYPWDGLEEVEPPHVPKLSNPTGVYHKDIKLEKKPNTFIVFYGVQTAMELYVNGRFVGYAEDSFTPSEFDISQYIEDGRNRITVRVFHYSSASWLEDQDYWRFSGIFRTVEIQTRPNGYMKDIDSRTILSDDYDKGWLIVKVITDAPKLRLTAMGDVDEVDVEDEETELSLTFDHPKLWSAEKPNLMPFRIETLDKDGNTIEYCDMKAGFREIAIKKGIMLINGERIVFHGVNRHEWSQEHGRTITHEEMLYDVLTMKRNNINAVRTSHYPNDPYFYDLCDEYGLYVISETNLETHGSWQKFSSIDREGAIPGDDMEWLPAVLDRAKSNYETLKNHPSIVMWSLGNESFGGEVLKLEADYFHSADSLRPVHYEGVSHDRTYDDETSDVESQMYTPAEDVEMFLRRNTNKPFILCEYSHAMGNSCGALMDYIRLEREEENYQGGFIWDFIDQTLKNGSEIAYGGDFGDRPSDLSFCANGLLFGDRTVSPKMQEVKYAYQNFEIEINEEDIKVTNRNLFSNLAEFDQTLEHFSDGKLIESKKYNFNVIPGKEQHFPNPFEMLEGHSDSIRLSISLKEDTPWARKGYVVAHQEMYRIAETEYEIENEATVIEGDRNFGFRMPGLTALVERQKGGLISFRKNGKELFKDIPYLSFWRAPVDNDKGSMLPSRFARWSADGLWAKSMGSTLDTEDKEKKVHTLYELCVSGDDMIIEEGVSGDGRIRITLTYRGREALVPEFGMAFTLFHVDGDVTYLGLGPEENMPDRKEGALFGLYSFDPDTNLTPYHVPQEGGTRCGVKWAQVGDLRIEAEDEMVISISPWTAEEVEAAEHTDELPPIKKTIVRVLKGMTGVGGDNSWGALPHQSDLYRICYGDKFTFYLS